MPALAKSRLGSYVSHARSPAPLPGLTPGQPVPARPPAGTLLRAPALLPLTGEPLAEHLQPVPLVERAAGVHGAPHRLVELQLRLEARVHPAEGPRAERREGGAGRARGERGAGGHSLRVRLGGPHGGQRLLPAQPLRFHQVGGDHGHAAAHPGVAATQGRPVSGSAAAAGSAEPRRGPGLTSGRARRHRPPGPRPGTRRTRPGGSAGPRRARPAPGRAWPAAPARPAAPLRPPSAPPPPPPPTAPPGTSWSPRRRRRAPPAPAPSRREPPWPREPGGKRRPRRGSAFRFPCDSVEGLISVVIVAQLSVPTDSLLAASLCVCLNSSFF